MPTNPLREMINSKDYILADGATGTNLFNMGLSSGDAPELWNKSAPKKIKKLYKDSVDAGSD
ncbi:MAG: methionine synthase, partial [Planktomarina sp.]|nr:methionine synthase [Planktomarina sp.]